MVFERGTSSQNKPGENSPLLPSYSSETGQSGHLASLPKSFGNILIAIVGAGVLGLPYTFMKTGWLAGVLVLGIVAALTYYCMMLLVWTKRKLISEGYVKIVSFGDVGFLTCGNVGKAMVDAMIILTQAGFCVSYLIFVGSSVSSIIFQQEAMLNKGSQYPTLSAIQMLRETRVLGISVKALLIWAQFPFQLGLNAIKSLTHLAPLSIFADIVDVAAMLVVMVQNALKYFHSAPYLVAFTGVGSIPYGVGVAIYAFEGVGIILPLESEADKKSHFGKLLGIAVCLITFTYGAFGLLGYFAFGPDTQDIITLNLGNGLVTDLVKLCLSINLFFTFPLMMNPVHEVIESRFNGGRYSFLMRSCTVLATTLVALMVPNFSDFLSLVGSSVCCMLGFVLPATFHLIACREKCSFLQILFDVLIICFGLVFGVLGTISSVRQIFSPALEG